MTAPTSVSESPVVAAELRRALLRLAKAEIDLAAEESARVPYWEPCPSSVVAHRAAAQALLVEADSMLALTG
jgi:hypothetical protein